MALLVLVPYFVALAALALLCLFRLGLLWGAARHGSPQSHGVATVGTPVLVQLPIFNERYVAERLMRAVAAQKHWPLTVQVLDDSTDDTCHVVDRTAAELRRQGVDVQVVRRPHRQGFKAGALAHGLAQDSGPAFVAIFDADFVPGPDFLQRALPPLLAHPDVGMVQARWGHLNRDENWLTRAQAVFLDGHFQVEHAGRAGLGHFFNFNGTAGVWRRQAILEAGGWSGDTITEDLDLSYRAQLAGWRFLYLPDLVADAELPSSMTAFLAQQARWVQGSVQTLRKLGWRMLTEPKLSWGRRAGALSHLGNNLAYALMALVAVLLPSAVMLRDQAGWRVPGGEALWSWLDLIFLFSGTFSVCLFYGFGLVRTGARGRWTEVPLALVVGAGISLSNARAVWAGLTHSHSAFVRTPKRGDAGRKARYRGRTSWGGGLPELLMAVYHGIGCIYALRTGLWPAVPFLLLHGLGFAWVGMAGPRTWFESWRARELWVRRPSPR